MRLTKRFLGLIAAALLATGAWAQMEFTYSAAATETKTSDGSTFVQFPAGTELTGVITGVKVNGQDVNPDDVTPNPTKTVITDGEIETFVCDGKAYSFRFLSGGYFTMVIFSDPHVDSEAIQNSVATKAAAIATMGTDGGKKISFNKAPLEFIPKADIVFCLGDLDANRDMDGKYFKPATSVFNEKGIPFIVLVGNHDIEPDYYNDNSKGMSSNGNKATTSSLNIMKDSYNKAAALENGIKDVVTITDNNLSNVTQIGQFTFTYRDVRFYCASSYWWQKPYKYSFLSASYYSAEGTVNALNSFVEEHKEEASVWLSHYPFVAEANSGEDKNERWWLDQNYPSDGSTPKSITPSSTSQYYTSAAFNTEAGRTVATLKKKALADIIVKSANPVHFSGHAHKNETHSYTANDNKTSFTDYTIQPFTQGSNNAFVVLCKEGVGVVEVQTATF